MTSINVNVDWANALKHCDGVIPLNLSQQYFYELQCMYGSVSGISASMTLLREAIVDIAFFSSSRAILES